MPIRMLAVLRDALSLFRRDRDWLLAVAGPFLFLPSFALGLLVPRWPGLPREAAGAGDAGTLAWADRFGDWLAAYGPWYAIAYAVAGFGTAALLSGYLDGRAGDVRGALRGAGRLVPRYLLASLLVAIPTGAGLYLWYLPGFYVMARTIAVGPALVAERPLGAVGAVARSFALTAGAGLPLMAVTMTVLLGGIVAGQPFAMLDAGAGTNRLLDVTAAAGLAAVSALTNIAQALVAVSAYRRLSVR